jgi:hypothetical protein
LKKNSPEKDMLKPEEIEAGFYVIADDKHRNEKTGYFIGEVVGTFIDSEIKENFLVKSKAAAMEFWLTNIDSATVINIAYFVRKATDLEMALV